MLKVILLSIIIILITLNFPNYIIMSSSRSHNSSPVSNNDGWVSTTKQVRRTIAEIPRSIAGYVVSRLKEMRQDMNEVFGRGTYRFEWRTEDSLLILHGSRNQQEHMIYLLTECFRNFNSRRRHRAEEFFIWNDLPKKNITEVTEEKSTNTTTNSFDILATLKSQDEIDEENAKKERRRRKEAQKVYESWKHNIQFNWAEC